jgi:hypothetical protein
MVCGAAEHVRCRPLPSEQAFAGVTDPMLKPVRLPDCNGVEARHKVEAAHDL